MRILRVIGFSLAGLVATYLIAAVGAVLWPAKIFGNAAVPTAAEFASRQRASGVRTDQVYPYEEQRFIARDGVRLFARVFGKPAERTIVLLHGVTSDSSAMNDSAGEIHVTTGSRVIALDLRGHGLPILYFNQPGAPAYGFAALQSMQPNAPRDYRCALSAIRVPLLVVVGSKDEAFNALAYPDVLRASGHVDSTKIIDGSTHNRVLGDSRTIDIVSQWISRI